MRTDCERFDALHLDQEEGTTLSGADQQFLADHGASCARCRRLEASLALMALSTREPAHFESNELADERLLRGVLEQTRRARPSRAPRRALIALAAVLAIGLVSWTLLRRPDSTPTPTPLARVEPAPTPTPPAPPTPPVVALERARVNLASRGESLALGAPLEEGAVVEPTAGAAAVQAGEAVFLWFSKGTRARLVSLTRDAMSVSLERGEVRVSVVPKAGVRLSVVPPWGEVKVVGTVFAVSATARGGAVRVQEGRVRVEAAGREGFELGTGEGFLVGGRGPAPLSRSERQALERFEDLAVLSRGGEARLAVRAAGTEQPLRVDGVPVGSGAVSLLVKGGRHRVEQGAPGKAARTKVVELDESGEVEVDVAAKATATPRSPKGTPSVEPPPSGVTPGGAGLVGPTSAPEIRTPPATVSVDELVKRALGARAARDWTAAAAAYDELQRLHPDSAAARAADVSHGQLLIDHLGRARQGLTSCERYLEREPRGALAIEAELCRIRAHRALGSAGEERALIERFLARWPTDFHAPELTRRLEALRGAAR